jgi:hypothetical protein
MLNVPECPEENVPECPGRKYAGVSASATLTLVYI